MWTSLPTVLMAILLLSNPTEARFKKRTVTIEACTSTESAAFSARSLKKAVVTQEPVIVYSTLTVVPVPVGTVDGIFYSGVPSGTGSAAFPTATGVSSGVFWPGYASGSGSGAPRPTGSFHNGTSNRTHHHPVGGKSNSTSSSFLTLNNTSVASVEVTFSLIPTSIIFPKPTTTAVPTTLEPTTIAIPTISSIIYTPTSTSVASIPTPSSPANTTIPFLRGVNLGGWLVLEKWMNSEAFSGAFSSAVDQFTFDSLPNAASALEQHWSTFFTEADIQTLAATGINALRIPIGFWAYDNADTPYIQGADAYLEKAIVWARKAGMKVWVDCHGSPGSQNGFDNSGKAGNVDWQQTSNLQRSISVLKTMAKKYGAQEYADVVVGLELTNEPISYGNNKFSVTKQWAQDAYTSIKSEIENEDLVLVMHDAFQGATAWTNVASTLVGDSEKKSFGIDTHLYQLFSDSYNAMTQAEHISAACAWSTDLATANKVMPTYVGEWSAATNICVNPDGSTTAGTSCSTSGCQCQSENFENWNDNMIEQVRRFVEAQLDVFEQNSSGYFAWSAKGPGGWGFLNGIEKGVIPNPVTSRKYAAQCEGKKMMIRGSSEARA